MELPRTGAGLADWVREARERTLALVSDLSGEELLGPRLAVTNPFLWELGHVAWFQERFVLREGRGDEPLHRHGDELWNSSEVAHDTRWDLALPPLDETLAYMRAVHERVLAGLEREEPSPRERYFVLLTLFHEDMHGEAFLYMRQTLGYAPPPLPEFELALPDTGTFAPLGDAILEGGTFELGAAPNADFVFDNEKWAHPVEVAPFAMSRTALTQAEFREFVDAGGYERDELWSEEGLRWRAAENVRSPAYWKCEGGDWYRRHFDSWVPLEPDLPVVHVSWHEAQAYCRFAGRRLPTEAEWEFASHAGDAQRPSPWGTTQFAERAHLEAHGGGPAPVHAYAEGDCPRGCRQLWGNVWEWTATTFEPYPGFVIDPYEDYSAPWFGTRKVLRGGAWATRGRMLRNTWRNYFEPHRRDVIAGLRTCALSPESAQ